MYQDQCDMVEEEYLRRRIRNILQQQVAERGYGANWNATLGAREIRGPIANQATVYQNLPLNEGENEANKGGVNVGGVQVGGAPCGGVVIGGALKDYSLKQLRQFVRDHNRQLQQKNKIKNYLKLNKQQLLRKLNKLNFRVKVQEAKGKRITKKKQMKKKGKKLSAYNEFAAQMRRKGHSFKEIGKMWKKQKGKGGQMVCPPSQQGYAGKLPPGYMQAGQCEMKSDWEQFLKCQEAQGGYYLR